MTDLPNDPTRAGAPVAGAAVLSLPEVQSLCTKAARGAGMSWGMAEEAGHAAEWLAGRGLSGPEQLLLYLEAAGETWDGRGPSIGTSVWRAADGAALCPLTTGAAFADLAGPLPLAIERLSQPGLILPSLALVAGVLGHPIRLEWGDSEVLVNTDALGQTEAAARLFDMEEADVTLSATEVVVTGAPRESGHAVSRAVWQSLDRLALLTTVPATEQSRADAGAGGSDND